MSAQNNRKPLLRVFLSLEIVLLLALSVHFTRISVQLIFLVLSGAAALVLCFSRILGHRALRAAWIATSALLVCIGIVLCVVWPATARQAAYTVPEVDRSSVFAGRRVMLIVPHEDDEVNVLSGVMEQYTAAGSELIVVFESNGDSRTSGETRMLEALRAAALYGVPEENVVFLGYGDTGSDQTKHLYNMVPGDEICRSSAERTHTYGLASHPAFRSSDYTRDNLVRDCKDLLEAYLPDTIYCVDYDAHPDHRATSLVFEEALGKVLQERADYAPLVCKGFAYQTAWQAVDDFYSDNLLSTVKASQTPYMSENNIYNWDERLRLPVAADTLSRLQFQILTQRALAAHDSQNAVWQTGRILNGDKVFWLRNTSGLLYRAKIGASSGDASVLNDFKLTDSADVLSGDPPFDNAWSPDSDDPSPTVTIALQEPAVLSELRLYDQPSLTDNILGVQILLDGDRTIEAGPLVQNGSATVIPLDSATAVSQIELVITGAEGEHWGLTEVEAYTEPPQSGLAFSKLTDEAGNFLYDAWTNPDGTLRLKLYCFPATGADRIAESAVSADNPCCTVTAESDSVEVSCPVNESCLVSVSTGADGAVADTIRVSNPGSGERAFVHALQWMESRHLDAIQQRAYYRTVFGALFSKISE